MRALVASCVFPPEPVVSAKTSADIAVFFDSIGYETVVICPKPTRNYQPGLGYSDSVKTIRLFSVKSRKSTFLSRFFENISFGMSSFFHIIFSKKYDVIYSNVWPVFATGLVVLAAKIKRSKVILSVQDLYPESLVQQSRITPQSLIYKTLFKMDTLISSSVNHVIVISEKFYESYNKGRNISLSNLSLIPNWVDAKKITPLDKNTAREQLSSITNNFFSSENSFYVVYGGNVGVASGLDMLPELIQALPSNFKFLIAGDGALLKDIKEKVKATGGEESVFFLSPWPESLTSVVFSAADLLFLPTAPGQSLASVPSKLITYMLSERPVFAVVDSVSDTCREINNAQGGFVCDSHDIEDIGKALTKIAGTPNDELTKMGERSRCYAISQYSFDSVKPKLLTILKHIYEG